MPFQERTSVTNSQKVQNEEKRVSSCAPVGSGRQGCEGCPHPKCWERASISKRQDSHAERDERLPVSLRSPSQHAGSQHALRVQPVQNYYSLLKTATPMGQPRTGRFSTGDAVGMSISLGRTPVTTGCSSVPRAAVEKRLSCAGRHFEFHIPGQIS